MGRSLTSVVRERHSAIESMERRVLLSSTAVPPVPVPATVEHRYIFYNDSAFDQNNPAATLEDDAAIATDKHALLPGHAATLANYTSYSKGINGIMIDVAHLPGDSLSPDDFVFRLGNQFPLAAWSPASDPTSITVRSGAGVRGSDRVELTWPDYPDPHAIVGEWIQVTVKANARTGLAHPDVFYFGNAPGDTGLGNTADLALVNATDEIAVRSHPSNFLNPASVENPYDFNRDRRVDATDQILTRTRGTNFISALRFISAPRATISDLYNTGVITDNDTGLNAALLSVGDADPHYTFISGPQSPPTSQGEVELADPAWQANGPASQWLGVVGIGSTPVARGLYTFVTTFTLPDNVDLSSVVLSFHYGSDNSIADVALNGQSTGLSSGNSFHLSGPLTLNATNGHFQTGLNTLKFVILNADNGANNAFGFRIDQIQGSYAVTPDA